MEQQSIVVQAPTLVVNAGPFGFHIYASEFLQVAKSTSPGSSFSPVPYYLYCRSLELVLKAFLLGNGFSVKAVKDRPFGHNLVRTLQECEKHGLQKLLTITSEHKAELAKANKYYDIPLKGFEYFHVTKAVTGYPDLPRLEVLDDLADRLVSSLRKFCTDALQP